MVIQVNLGSGGAGPSRPPGWMVYVPGAVMIGFGILILVVPNLIQLLVASLCIFIGIILIMAPRGIRKMGWPGTGGGGNPFGGGSGFGGFGSGPPPA